MTYLSDKKRKTSRTKYVFFFLFFFVLIYFWVGIRGYIKTNESPAFTYYGVKKVITYVPELLHTFFYSKETLINEKHALELQVAQLHNELARLQYADGATATQTGSPAQDASSTSEAVTEVTIADTIIMYPLMRDITTLYSTILLSKGSNDGVSQDALVYLSGRGLVCKIEQVSDRTSLCHLFTGYGQSIDGVFGTSSIRLLGDGGGAYIGEVARNNSIKEGDIIRYKGDPTMTIGTVVSVVRDMQAAFAKIYVRGVYSETGESIFYADK